MYYIRDVLCTRNVSLFVMYYLFTFMMLADLVLLDAVSARAQRDKCVYICIYIYIYTYIYICVPALRRQRLQHPHPQGMCGV